MPLSVDQASLAQHLQCSLPPTGRGPVEGVRLVQTLHGLCNRSATQPPMHAMSLLAHVLGGGANRVPALAAALETAPPSCRKLSIGFARALCRVWQVHPAIRATLGSQIREVFDHCDSNKLHDWWRELPDAERDVRIDFYIDRLLAQSAGEALHGLTAYERLMGDTMQMVVCAWPCSTPVPLLPVACGVLPWDPSNPLGDPQRATPDCARAPFCVVV